MRLHSPTVLIPLSQMIDRLDVSREESDVAYFYDLLHAGEMLTKIATVGLIACLEDDRERHRYRLEFTIVHANSLGVWSSVLDDALTGPASQYLVDEAQSIQRELGQSFRVAGGEWQMEAVIQLHQALAVVDKHAKSLPQKVSARRWFADFVQLRNRTRGHGATTLASCSSACAPLRSAIDILLNNLSLFRLPWAHLHRNLSGKYRVTSLGTGIAPFEPMKSSKDYTFPSGVYLWADGPRKVSLLSTDDDVRDFYLPNGGFNEKTYELLSYATDTSIVSTADSYLTLPSVLAASETQGLGELDVTGNVFANLPRPVKGYVRREALEDELTSVLQDERHPVVTLVGRGGIGKTSLALEVLNSIAEETRYFAIIWFSSRDIDLLPDGPKLVRPHVLSPADMAQEYVSLIKPTKSGKKDFRPLDFFANALSEQGDSPTLFVFDNFETVRSPVELHRWLDTHIRSPNKILLTTRRREFKGDYWVEVGGMTEEQFTELVTRTAGELKVDHLIDSGYVSALYRESDGHPYIAKVLLGEIARSGKRQKVERIIASQDRVLEALFERTFTQLAPAAQRIFLTLSNWRSLVPMVALEATANRPGNERMDIEQVVDELHRSSMLQITVSDHSDTYLDVPLSAAIFGKKKLGASPWQAAVDADTEVLRLFGVVQVGGVRRGFDAQVERLFQNASEHIQKRPSEFERYRPVLEFVSRERPMAWVFFAQLLEEHRPGQEWAKDAADAYRRYLESVPGDGQIWRTLARVCMQSGDHLGAVQALVQRSKLPDAPYADVSYAAVTISAYLADHVLELDTDEKRILIGGLIDVMLRREKEANATDLSRLAWLLIYVGRRADAKQVVRVALDREPSNQHCRKLAHTLKVRSSSKKQ